MRSWAHVNVPRLATVIPELHLTNSASGLKQSLGQKDHYRMYVCGITPYDATHLGHAATYLTFDLINRFLLASGARIDYVQNITDVDDPLLERAVRDDVNWRDLAQQQIELFRSDMTALRVIPPQHYIGAIEAIPLVTRAITALADKASIYQVDSDLYFTVHADPNFGSRSHLTTIEMLDIFAQRGGDPLRAGKRAALDCLVWMSQRANEPGWPSEHGVGRPGWHIECTAIAIEYLAPDLTDQTLIDIQGGGSDLIFPHHEMCAAQATVLSGKEFAANYVHTGMIGLDGEKMSKSKGNLVLVSTLLAQGIDPKVIRWALMLSSYRTDRMWSSQLLTQAQNSIDLMSQALAGHTWAATSGLISNIVGALADDLDTPKVLMLLDNWAQLSINGATDGDRDLLKHTLDALLGLNF